MNKLVSKNPIQRFKQGRKIVKGADGLKSTKYGEQAYFLDNNGKVYTGHINHLGSSNSKRLTHRYVLNGKQYGSFDGGKTYYGLSEGGRPLSYKANQQLLKMIGNSKNKKSPDLTNNITSNRVSTPVSTTRRPLKTKEQWESEFNDAKNKLTAKQLMYLDSLNINTNSAEEMQKSINAYNKDSGLVEDNKWGPNSQAALSKILSSMPNDYRNEDTQWGLDNEKNVPDVVPVVPTKPIINLGYRTSNTYENNDFSDRLRNMGIRSNADLIDFMHRTNGENYNWNGDNWARQFRSDVNQALGGDYSDANIRRIFHTKNGWGGGFLGGGDFTDFQNALQTNAGVWNGMYERNLGNYVKNIDWSKFKLYKQGGQLISRNPVKRFKQKNFMLVAQ